MLSSGVLDRSLSPELEAILAGAAKRGNTPIFLRRLVNFLQLKGGEARINQDTLLVLAGTDHLRQLRRFKKAGIEAGLFVASGDAIRSVQSTRYTLTSWARNGGELRAAGVSVSEERASADCVGASMLTDDPSDRAA